MKEQFYPKAWYFILLSICVISESTASTVRVHNKTDRNFYAKVQFVATAKAQEALVGAGMIYDFKKMAWPYKVWVASVTGKNKHGEWQEIVTLSNQTKEFVKNIKKEFTIRVVQDPKKGYVMEGTLINGLTL